MFLARSPLAVHSLYVSTILVSLLCTLRGLYLAAQRSRGGADQIARLLRLALALSLILTTFLLQSLVLAATYAGRAGVGSAEVETLLKTLQELGLEGDVALSRAGFCFSLATWTLARGTELIDGVDLGSTFLSSSFPLLIIIASRQNVVASALPPLTLPSLARRAVDRHARAVSPPRCIACASVSPLLLVPPRLPSALDLLCFWRIQFAGNVSFIPAHPEQS